MNGLRKNSAFSPGGGAGRRRPAEMLNPQLLNVLQGMSSLEGMGAPAHALVASSLFDTLTGVVSPCFIRLIFGSAARYAAQSSRTHLAHES